MAFFFVASALVLSLRKWLDIQLLYLFCNESELSYNFGGQNSKVKISSSILNNLEKQNTKLRKTEY